MSKKIIKTDKASLPVGPYNQAVSIGNLIYTAGQIPLDRFGDMVKGGIKEQTQQVLENLKVVLEAGGSSLEKVVKATVFLKDLNDFADSACDNEVIMILNPVVLGKPHHYSGMPRNMCAMSEINEGKPAAKELSSLG